MAVAALFGVFTVIMVMRRIAQKRFRRQSHADRFLDDVRDNLKAGNFSYITEELCDSPPYWSKAVPQLIMVAIANRDRPATKLRRLVAEKFEIEILSDLEYRASWIATVVKSAPMLGLLGTVLGMISAFGTIAGSGKTGVDPGALANDIGLALNTTAIGLAIAIPMVMAGAMVHIRIGKLQDAVQQQLSVFLDDLDVANSQTGSA